jgi:hypothetical protein
MRRKSDQPLQKHTLLLFEGDFEKLAELHPEVPKSIVVRLLVRKHLKDNIIPIKLSEVKPWIP